MAEVGPLILHNLIYAPREAECCTISPDDTPQLLGIPIAHWQAELEEKMQTDSQRKVAASSAEDFLKESTLARD